MSAMHHPVTYYHRCTDRAQMYTFCSDPLRAAHDASGLTHESSRMQLAPKIPHSTQANLPPYHRNFLHLWRNTHRKSYDSPPLSRQVS